VEVMLADGMDFMASYNGKITILKEGREFEIINQHQQSQRNQHQ